MSNAWQERIRRFITPLLAAAICLGIAVIVLSALGFGREPGDGLWRGVQRIGKVVWERSLLPRPPSRYRRVTENPSWIETLATARSWVQSLIAATPILLTGLAVAIAFRASVLNIGGEGQFVVGTIAAAAVGLKAHGPSGVNVALLLGAAAISGAAWAGLAGVLEQWRRVPVVLGTLLLNFIAIVLLKSLIQGPLHEAGDQLQSEELAETSRLAHVTLHGTVTQLHAGFFVALASAVVVAVILRATTFGFRIRAVGQNAVAARFAGIAVSRIAVMTLCLSGAMAGLAGGIQISGVPPYQLLPDTGSSGFGFAGIAVALLGRLSPLGVVLSSLFFGWLQIAFFGLQAELHVPFLALQATQGAILIAILILTGRPPGFLRRWFRSTAAGD